MLAPPDRDSKKVRVPLARGPASPYARRPQMRNWLLGLAIVLLPVLAHAQAEHTVRGGQSLARIARRYNVSVSSLAAANGLARGAQIRPGMVLRLPEAGVHYVAEGETLAGIARQHACSVTDLARENRLGEGRPLRIGQRLLLPGFEPPRERERAESRWGRPRHPGVATLYRRALDRRFRVRLVDERRQVRRAGTRRLQELMRPSEGRRLGPAPPRRLIEILAQISDHFGGRTMTIVSGYRTAGGDTRESSRHTRGHALDIRITGVPNHELRDYVRSSFRNVGVGYYPRSSFVHVDVRERSAYWIDWSRPGESPRYQTRGEAPPDDATARERAHAGEGGEEGEEAEGTVANAEDDGRGRDPDQAAVEEE
jgi:LysM repeat protein